VQSGSQHRPRLDIRVPLTLGAQRLGRVDDQTPVVLGSSRGRVRLELATTPPMAQRRVRVPVTHLGEVVTHLGEVVYVTVV
jgi:hypothetical protein